MKVSRNFIKLFICMLLASHGTQLFASIPTSCQPISTDVEGLKAVDQGQNGLCWAASVAVVAGAALKKAGQCSAGNCVVSTTDIARCSSKGESGLINPAVGRDGGAAGGRPEWAANCFNDAGACSDQSKSMDEFTEKLKDPKFLKQVDFCVRGGGLACRRPDEAVARVESNPLQAAMSQIEQRGLCLENPELQTKEATCLSNLLTSRECREARQSPGRREVKLNPQRFAVANEKGLRKSNSDILAGMRERIQETGLPLVIGVCLEKMQGKGIKDLDERLSVFEQDSSLGSGDCQKPHAVVVSGIGPNCELQTINSWDKDPKDDPLEQLDRSGSDAMIGSMMEYMSF